MIVSVALFPTRPTAFAASAAKSEEGVASGFVGIDFVRASSTTLAEHDRGVSGEGPIAYSIDHSDRTKLLVCPTDDTRHRVARAEVFQASPSGEYIPFHRSRGHIVFPSKLKPVITMTAMGGWWAR